MLILNTKIIAQNTYIEKYQPIAKELSKEFGIPSAVIMSIAIIETGAGSSKSSQLHNNHFGLTSKNSTTGSKYRSFDSAKESFRTFCESIARRKYYQELKGNINPTDWINAIAAAGYSTKPTEWKKKILTAISKYKLNEEL